MRACDFFFYSLSYNFGIACQKSVLNMKCCKLQLATLHGKNCNIHYGSHGLRHGMSLCLKGEKIVTQDGVTAKCIA